MNPSDLSYTVDPRRALQEPAPAPQPLLSQNNPRTQNISSISISRQPPLAPGTTIPHQEMSPALNLSSMMHSDSQQVNFGSVFSNDLSTMPQLQHQLNNMQPTNVMSQQLLQQYQQQMPATTTQQPQLPQQPQQQLTTTPLQQISLQQQQLPQQQLPQQQLPQQQNPQQQNPQQQNPQPQLPQQQQLQSHLPQPQQLQHHQPNNDYLRSLMNQKIQFPPNIFDDHMRQRFMTAPAEPLLQPQLMNDPRFLMGPGGGLVGLHPSLAAPTNANRPFALPSPHELTLRDENRRMRGGVIEPFPEKLHRLLTEVEASGRGDVISFIANGKAFAIHKPDKFFKEIVPKYFRQSRLSSFKRQLNLYGFELINTGPARGGYYHEMFAKERPELCRRMRRIAIKLQSNTKTIEEEKQDQPKNPGFFDMHTVVTKQPTARGAEQQQATLSPENT